MEMESEKWCFEKKKEKEEPSPPQIREVVDALNKIVNKSGQKTIVPIGNGDPSLFPCFKTSPAAEDAVVDALKSASFNCYAPSLGLLPTRRAIADYRSRDLPYQLSPDDVYLTTGCGQAIEIAVAVLAKRGANILLPRPGYPAYEAQSACYGLQVHHFDLIPENGWEVDLEGVKSLANENTAAMVIINPGNPCGNVYSYQHLKKIAETARKLGIMVISDEVYGDFAFGNSPFVQMGTFGSVVPVLTLGSISKSWIVPGWRLGWIVTNDPNGVLKRTGIIESIVARVTLSPRPATYLQAALPRIIENTPGSFFFKIKNILREDADICYNGLQDIPCLTCPSKPEGSMFVMVKLNLSMLEDIEDDTDFCFKLAKEESTIIIPGITVGFKNWLRISFSAEPSTLKDGLERIKAFCQRHMKTQYRFIAGKNEFFRGENKRN